MIDIKYLYLENRDICNICIIKRRYHNIYLTSDYVVYLNLLNIL